MNPGFAEQSARLTVQVAGLFNRKNSGGEVKADALAFLAGIDAAQEQNRSVDTAFAELNAFRQKSDPESIDTEYFKFAAYIHETVSVGVGLDDCQNLRSGLDRGADDAEVVS